MENNTEITYEIMSVCRYNREMMVKFSDGTFVNMDVIDSITKDNIDAYVMVHYENKPYLDTPVLQLAEKVIREDTLLKAAARDQAINDDFLAAINAKLLED